MTVSRDTSECALCAPAAGGALGKLGDLVPLNGFGVSQFSAFPPIVLGMSGRQWKAMVVYACSTWVADDRLHLRYETDSIRAVVVRSIGGPR